MIYIPNSNHEAALNLAMEEYILTSGKFGNEILFFYINDPSIIIGRHQNTREEINAEYVSENHIPVVRRRSGGGAVYHDRGNLNYSLIYPGSSASPEFSAMLSPIIACLRDLGLDAELSGRNDITVNGAKFSGNAYYHNKSGSVMHGTLLYDSDLTVLAKALQPRPEKYLSKGVKSVRSRVCTIRELLPGVPNIEALEQAIVSHFSKSNDLHVENFTEEDRVQYEAIANQRYRSDVWNYGESPAFNKQALIRQPGGTIDFRAVVSDGIVHQARLFGDFFSPWDVSILESAMEGKAWSKDALAAALSEAGWQACFPDFPLEDFLSQLPL